MTIPIDFEANPLIPAVIQDDASGEVLMVGFMNQLAFEKTQETGFVHFWSRSRNALWKKGETSGHTQEVISIALNCEANSLLIMAIQNGAVCHTGHTTCYYRQILPDGTLFETSDPVFDPNEVYESAPPSEQNQLNRSKAEHGAATVPIGSWFGAYEYLARQPLQDVSRTSRLLHDGALPFNRVADELVELADVLAGKHRHSGDLEQDVLLEGSQVLYWLNLVAIGLSQTWDTDLDLASVMFPPLDFYESTVPQVKELRKAAARWRTADAQFEKAHSDSHAELVAELSGAYWLVSRAVAPIVKPIQLVRRDLAELETKPYLADYFSSVEG